MTAVTAGCSGLSRADRQRILDRLAELGGLAELMRESGSLAAPDEPVPLHRASRDTTAERTTS